MCLLPYVPRCNPANPLIHIVSVDQTVHCSCAIEPVGISAAFAAHGLSLYQCIVVERVAISSGPRLHLPIFMYHGHVLSPLERHFIHP